MREIYLSNVPEPKGHYSPAVVHNGLIFVSGQLPRDPKTGEVETGDIRLQTEIALRNVEAILKEAGSDLGHVLQFTIYVSDMSLWDEVNAAYASILGNHKPARAIVPVGELHFGAKIEIQAVACVISG